MTLVHHYSSIQSSFIVLKILCALPIHPNLFLGFFQSFVKPSFSMGVVNSKPTTWWHQKLNFKFWLDPASRKAAFTVEETEAMFLSDPMIQGHKSTSLYMKTGRMVLFTQRGKKQVLYFRAECFEGCECFSSGLLLGCWPTHV